MGILFDTWGYNTTLLPNLILTNTIWLSPKAKSCLITLTCLKSAILLFKKDNSIYKI